MTIVWVPSAKRDLSSISACHESADGKAKASGVLQRIVHGASRLIEKPFLGHVSDSVDGVLELHVENTPYLLPYRVVDRHVRILRVFHESQDRPSAWQIE
ncbi:MAG: type II toxin-antitoxin system RelE/ParE family toxin [Roseiarcus sp.]|jgi:plasmid stabilization system protein ParE